MTLPVHTPRVDQLLSVTQLQAFVAVAASGSFTHATADIGVSQPAVSELIRRLEHDVSAPLVRRHGGTADLTSAGLRLLPLAERAIYAAREATRAARGFKAEGAGRLRAALITSSL